MEIIDNDNRADNICRVRSCNQISKTNTYKKGKKARRGTKPFCGSHMGVKGFLNKSELRKVKLGSLVDYDT